MAHDQFRSWEGRCWVDSSPVHVAAKGLPRVRFLTYCLLAHYKTAYLNYSSHKTWDYRSKILIQELLCYDADIVCLQDVDLFHEFWYPRLMSIGYDMVFKQRTQEKEYRNEGIIIAFKRDRFQLCRTVALEFNNAVLDDSKGTTFRERCRTDDVGLIVFLQPNNRQDIPCMLGVATTMLSGLVVNSDVRATHMEYFTQQIELANREFQAPFLLGINLNDIPASAAYTLLRTGRVALTAQVPLACTAVTATAICRGSALVKWLPPKISIADSAITSYEIAWRPGGSPTLGFSLFRTVIAGDCIHYSEQTDERGRKKIVADTTLQYTIAGLSSDMVYEFIVRGINNEGPGLWSAPSLPIVLPNPDKAPRLPELDTKYFSPMDSVYELRERDAMSDSDWNIHLALKADPLNAPTQLTPRIEDDGRINYPIARSRLLPVLDNPRIGWKSTLLGVQDARLTAEISRDYVLGKSILRDKYGYKERNLNTLQYEVGASNNIQRIAHFLESYASLEEEQSTQTSVIIDSTLTNTTRSDIDEDMPLQAEQQLLEVQEQVSIRMVTDDSYIDVDVQAPPASSSSLLFTSTEPNRLALPALFKKQRLERTAEDFHVRQESEPSYTQRSQLSQDEDASFDDEMNEFSSIQSSRAKSKKRLKLNSYELPQVETIPLSSIERPVYTTTQKNNALTLYQAPNSSSAQVPDSLINLPGLSPFAQMNPVVNPMTHLAPNNAIAKVLDGASLLLDGKEVLHHIGASHPRHRHGLGLRSVYEISGSTYGEPMFTAVVPRERNTMGTETFDYIFYSQSYGLVPCSHLSLPSISTVMQSFAMFSGRGETPETDLIIPDLQTRCPPAQFAEDFDEQILSLYVKTYDAVHIDEEEEDDTNQQIVTEDDEDEIDYGYGYSEEKKKQKATQKNKVVTTPQMRREKMDREHSSAEVQMMKRLLKEALRKSHAIDDQTTEHRPNSTNARLNSANNLNNNNSNSNNAGAKKGKGAARNAGSDPQFYSAQYRGYNRFWGGYWEELPMKNPSRNNFFLPNARFPSSHIALGADFVINEDVLPALWK